MVFGLDATCPPALDTVVGMAITATMPKLPRIRKYESPAVVKVLDRIRFEADQRPDDDWGEFAWFAREYPRCYRFHLEGADRRLTAIYRNFETILTEMLAQQPKDVESCFELARGDDRVKAIYWDFESFVSEVCVSLDLLARIVGPAFKQHTPISFSKLCKMEDAHPLLQHFRDAKEAWVQRLKDYRDCFTHYTPVDTLLLVVLRRYGDKWDLRAKLPVNPNVRVIDGFRYSRRIELLRYAIHIHRKMTAFDRRVAEELTKLYDSGQFPLRVEGLFYIGQRSR
jgi:hypothetical protein